MNNKFDYKNKNESLSIGDYLRIAREQLGLSQQTVARRLCLKVSIIRNIEENNFPSDLAWIFIYGYIRSYARLVRIPEEKIISIIENQNLSTLFKNKVMSNFAYKKYIKRYNNWIVNIIYLILFIIIFTAIFLISQKYVTQNKNINDKISQSTFLNKIGNLNTTFSFLKYHINDIKSFSFIENFFKKNNFEKKNKSIQFTNRFDDYQSSTNQNFITKFNVNSNILFISFIADCWFEVTDINGKKIFKGLQHKNNKLIFKNKNYYKLKIGAPAAIKIFYKGKYIDLSNFIKKRQVAYITLNYDDY